jgi:predicted transcriptional regulator
MAALWHLQRGSVAQITAVVNRTRAVTYSTVQTILRILEPTGNVRHQMVAGALVSPPVVDVGQARRRALRHLVKRLFDGSLSLLVLNVLEDEDLDPAERERLRKLIDRA